MVAPDEILAFWLDELSPRDWYNGSPELDRRIRERFAETWESAMSGDLGLWLTYPSGALAYILLTDQFPRNMFRDDERAFASDHLALAAAKAAIKEGFDLRIDEPARQFFYMPLMHSENLCDQERCVRLVCERMPRSGQGTLLHARAHREIIRRFGRFPFRNAALGRMSRSVERDFLEHSGYRQTLRSLEAEAA